MIILRQRTFSDKPEQKEFNNKTQKALRKTYDLAAGEKIVPYPLSPNKIISKGRKANRDIYKRRGGNTNDSINVKALNLGAESSSGKLSQGLEYNVKKDIGDSLYDHGIVDVADAKRLIKRTHS